ncbi:hypothetical protein GUJ93_ZPchr0002g25002 [Zizania palustris]|uniref:phosphoglycerate kinase n=1 Tax=Zizania palustris TaxID=103762 RepID=A0A8J5RUJ2_ZIZPA|nr:hypothetical protein GUJ93_ZPchr0002g25002 [Zizania palustris]
MNQIKKSFSAFGPAIMIDMNNARNRSVQLSVRGNCFFYSPNNDKVEIIQKAAAFKGGSRDATAIGVVADFLLLFLFDRAKPPPPPASYKERERSPRRRSHIESFAVWSLPNSNLALAPKSISDPREQGEMATKRSVGTLGEADLRGKKVFVRADLNVPLDDAQKITDDTRIRASVPTIKFLLGNGAKVILASHLGRPKGVTPKYSLKPLVPRLSELLGVDVVMSNDCIGEEVEKLAAALPDGGVLLLENVRFYKEEEKNDPDFAKKLASVADLYVNDAFGTAHRAHASTEGVTKFLKPAVAGFLMQKELDYLVGAVANPKKPFAAIVGGSKVSSKIGVIESLLAKVDVLILGGGMIFTFYKAQGYAVGKSLVEEDKLELATSLIEKAKTKGVALLLPTDVVVADKFAADAESKIVPASSIPDGWMGLDVGPDAIKTFNETLDTTKTIIWNGPMGVFEFEKFAAGTDAIAKKLAELTTTKGVTTIIGGGDSVAAVEKAGLADKMSHISTGGGASLELLEGKTLPDLGVTLQCRGCMNLRCRICLKELRITRSNQELSMLGAVLVPESEFALGQNGSCIDATNIRRPIGGGSRETLALADAYIRDHSSRPTLFPLAPLRRRLLPRSPSS